MTDPEIRISIAEACGWYRLRSAPEYFAPRGWVYGKHTYGKLRTADQLPNYPGDLNAMHEAENSLDDAQSQSYAERLGYDIHATARQRAEAFLRAMGKWEEV